MNKIILSILAISALTTVLTGCDDDSSDSTPSLSGVYYSNEGGILLAIGDPSEAIFNGVLLKSSQREQSNNTLTFSQLSDPSGINDLSNHKLTATYDGSGMQVSGFNTTSYLYQLPTNPPLPSKFAGSYKSGNADWTISSDNTFTATNNSDGCLISGELVYGPHYYIVTNTNATSCIDSELNGSYPDGYAVHGDLQSGKDWLGIVIWRNGAYLLDNVPLN